MRDLKSNIKPVQSLVPATRNAAANGTGVDLTGFNAASVVFSNGAIGGTTPSFTFEMQESDDNATFTAVAAKDLRGAAPVTTSANQVTQVGYVGYKRYIRAVVKTVAGTTPTLDCAAYVVLGHAGTAPTA